MSFNSAIYKQRGEREKGVGQASFMRSLGDVIMEKVNEGRADE